MTTWWSSEATQEPPCEEHSERDGNGTKADRGGDECDVKWQWVAGRVKRGVGAVAKGDGLGRCFRDGWKPEEHIRCSVCHDTKAHGAVIEKSLDTTSRDGTAG